MSKSYDALPALQLNEDTNYYQTGSLPELVHLEDTALSSMVDFKHMRALTVNADAPLKHARLEMQAAGVHMLFVLNNSQQISGIISSEDILGSKPIKITQDNHITRDEIKVRMVMQARDKILALTFDQVQSAAVGNIVQSMKDHQQHYAIVVESQDSGHNIVRGMFSLSGISRQLHTNLINADLMATSLADLQKKIDKL